MMSKAIPQAIIKSDPPCDLAIVHTKQTLSVAMLELKERELRYPGSTLQQHVGTPSLRCPTLWLIAECYDVKNQ